MVITVRCPSCSTDFPVDSNKIPRGGVSARCSSCGDVFRIERPEERAPSPRPPAPPSFETPTFEAPVEEPSAAFDRYGTPETDFSIGTEAHAASAGGGDWVLEREGEIDPGGLTIEPLDTVESSVEEARAEAGPDLADPMALPAEPADTFFSPPAPAPVPTREPEAPAVGGFSFGKRDPKDKARRLARVLVSDMISYNPERHERALASGSLKADFEEEIQKSWKEYVEQVGEEMASEHPFWVEALNDVLAKGERIF